MKRFNYQKGRAGEKIASDYLKKKGYQIIEANFQNRFGEIDLIASRTQNTSKALVFIEVKLRIGRDLGLPEEMITPGKIRQIKRMAEIFLQNNPKLKAIYPQQRLDAVCIVLDQDKKVEEIRHYENLDI